MLLFWDARLIMLSVPKTGSTAYEAALAPEAAFALRDPPPAKHMTWRRVQKLLATLQMDAEPFDTLAVLRHPVDWLGSWYRYRSRAELTGKPASTQGISFDQFIQGVMRPEEDRPPYARVGTQWEMIRTHDGTCGASHLIRYEASERLSAFLTDRLGPLPQIGRANVSPPGELELDPATRNALHSHLAQDFEAWESAAH